MSQIIELVREMRGRLPMYLGSHSITGLATLLGGYQLALHKNGLCPEDSFLADFQLFVEQRFGIEISKGWEDIIRFQSSGDNEAVCIFWELFDEFCSKRPTTCHSRESKV